MNNVILTGRLTKDVELKTIPTTGTIVATFTLAVDREYTKKDGSKETDFIPVEVYGKASEFCLNYLGKGRLVAVQGSLRFDKWNAPDGQYRTFAKVTARTIEALDKKDTNYSSKKDDNVSDAEEKLRELAESDIPF